MVVRLSPDNPVAVRGPWLDSPTRLSSCRSNSSVTVMCSPHEVIAFTDNHFRCIDPPHPPTAFHHRPKPLCILQESGDGLAQPGPRQLRLWKDHGTSRRFHSSCIFHLVPINGGRQRNENGRLSAGR